MAGDRTARQRHRHFVDIQASIATMTSRLVWWSSIGIAAAWTREARGAEVARDHARPNAMAVAVAGGAATAAMSGNRASG
jgi:hypothetical protein